MRGINKTRKVLMLWVLVMRSPLLSAMAVIVSLAPGLSQASTLDPLSILSNASAVVLGDFTTRGTTHVEGPVYVGGNLNSSSPFTYNQDAMPGVDIGGVQGGLVVGGDVNGNLQKAGNAPGAAQIGGSYNGSSNTGGLTLNQNVSGLQVNEMRALFEGLSSDLAGLDQTTGASFDTTQNRRNVKSGADRGDGIAVLNLNPSEALALLSATGAQNVDLFLNPSVRGFFINIAGTDFTGANSITAQLFQNQILQSRFAILNFYEATAIKFDSNANGTILAPYAKVESAPGGMNGVVVSSSFVLDGELRPVFDKDG